MRRRAKSALLLLALSFVGCSQVRPNGGGGTSLGGSPGASSAASAGSSGSGGGTPSSGAGSGGTSGLATTGGTTASGTASSTSSSGGTGTAVWSVAYAAGGSDADGNLMEGTELRALVPFNGSLYAGVGYWEDSEGYASTSPSPSLPGAQVLRLDSPDGGWQVDLNLTDLVTSGPQAGQRVEFAVAALAEVTLTTDSTGTALSPPVQLLAATTWAHAPGQHVYVRSAGAGWVASVLAADAGVNEGRAFASHVDAVTGVACAFTGSDVGIFSGPYDADAGTIAWSQLHEAWASASDTPPLDAGWRVMAFSDCGGALYASVGPSLYQRQDGPAPSWKTVYQASFPPGYDFSGNGGLRGATCLARDGGRQIFLAAEGQPADLLWVDPAAGFAATTDLDVQTLLTAALGAPAKYVLIAYNDVTPAVDPVTGENVLLIGFEATVPKAGVPLWDSGKGYYLASANYLVRHADGGYDLHTIDAPGLEAGGTPANVPHSTRTLALSPFDLGQSVYAGGFDCDDEVAHDTAWAAVAPLGAALGH